MKNNRVLPVSLVGFTSMLLLATSGVCQAQHRGGWAPPPVGRSGNTFTSNGHPYAFSWYATNPNTGGDASDNVCNYAIAIPGIGLYANGGSLGYLLNTLGLSVNAYGPGYSITGNTTIVLDKGVNDPNSASTVAPNAGDLLERYLLASAGSTNTNGGIELKISPASIVYQIVAQSPKPTLPCTISVQVAFGAATYASYGGGYAPVYVYSEVDTPQISLSCNVNGSTVTFVGTNTNRTIVYQYSTWFNCSLDSTGTGYLTIPFPTFLDPDTSDHPPICMRAICNAGMDTTLPNPFTATINARGEEHMVPTQAMGPK